MADLQNLQISQTYDGLIKTNDENAIDGNLKTLQDGSGNDLPMQVSTSTVNFTGTVTGIDTGVQSVVAGTNVTVDNTDPANPVVSAAGGGGGLTNYNGYPYSVNATGYGATYARMSQQMNSEIYWQDAIDQNANTIIMSRLLVEPNVEVTNFIPAFTSVTDNDTYNLGVYDTYDDGSPRDLVFSTTVSVAGASGPQYVDTTVSFTPTGNRYWIAMQSASGVASKMGMMPRSAFLSTYYTYGAWGSSPVGLLAVNSLYYTNGGGLPTNWAAGTAFGHRDEGLPMLYKTA